MTVAPASIGRAVIGVMAIAAVALFARELARFEARELSLEGLTLGPGDPEPFIRALAEDWYETEVSLDAGSAIVRASRRELGGRLDVDGAIEDIHVARGRATIWTRLGAMIRGGESQLRFTREVREDVTHTFVEALRGRTTVAPLPTNPHGEGGRAGVTLRLRDATTAIRSALLTDEPFVKLPVARLEPPVPPRRSLRTARFDRIVAERETRYASHGSLSGRANNIELAARLLDGALIEPHGELSFNEIVGERTYARGFSVAVELTRGGRRTEGIGGGICQVAATLHAAAFFGGFDIVEHHPHTRQSSYIEAGLDSAVSWPNRDLRIRNPHSFYVRVHARAYRGALRVALMGARAAPEVEWSTRVLRRIQRGVESEQGSGGEVVDEGEDGSVLERTRTIHWEGGAVTEVAQLHYPVVHRLVRGGGAAP